MRTPINVEYSKNRGSVGGTMPYLTPEDDGSRLGLTHPLANDSFTWLVAFVLTVVLMA
jgi:hypothetical protein